MAFDTLTPSIATNMLISVANSIIENKQYLSDIDSETGDGDHGIGMAGGMQKAKDKISSINETENAYRVFSEFGKTMLMSMGGASGIIFGSLFLAGAKEMPANCEITPKGFAAMMKKSLAAIKERGKAEVGDKTMVDALAPAVAALEANAEKGYSLMLLEATAAAKQGLESTKALQAKFGRAKSLMERAIGHQDAGATSVYLIFKSMYDFSIQ